MITLLRSFATLLIFALASLHFQDSGLTAGAATACGFLIAVCTWAAFGLARQVRLWLMAPRDHWRITPVKEFVLLGIEPAVLAMLFALLASAGLAEALGLELPEGGADVRG